MNGTAEKLNKKLENSTAESVLQYFIEQYKDKAVFTTSMGAEDQVITHIMAGVSQNASIITLDTGRMFYEVYDLIEKTESRYGVKIKIFFPAFEKVEEMVNTHGINLFYKSIENRKKCCQIRKTEPLKRALKNKDVWITGLRAEQSVTRQDLRIVEWDDLNKKMKVNPLLHWTRQDLWDYIHKHKIPYNPLHDKGYPSIGCQPCTRAIQEGEDVRAGRWWWENPETKECGLHVSKKE